MDSSTIPYAAWAGNIIMLGIGIWIIRSSLSQTRTDMKDAVKQMRESIRAIYDALHKHGHKGLDGNDNKVTRGD